MIHASFRCGKICFQCLRTAESYSDWESQWVSLLPNDNPHEASGLDGEVQREVSEPRRCWTLGLMLLKKNMTFQLADEWLIADDLKLQMTKDFPLCSFDHCTCGWLDSSPWEWSYFFSQRKFFHFSPSCFSFFLIFSFYFFHMKLMFLTLFFYLFLLYFFSLENVCLDSLFLSSFMLYLSLWTKILSSICLFPISFFCHAHTFPLLLSFLSRYLCLQNHLNVKVQNREHLKTFHAHMQKQITDGVRCQ